MTPGALLDVAGLSIRFGTGAQEKTVVDGIDFHVGRHETLGLVGESGSGKTMSILALLRLVPPPGRVAGGRICFEDRDLLTLPEAEMARLRGRRLAMIFQNPATSLDPLLTVSAQLAEVLRWHERIGRREAGARVLELLDLVGIADPAARMRQYPHELSGGMKQRVGIARALLCNPALVLADEPTTALDVTIQAQILDLLAELKRTRRMSVILVTHDMGVLARMADRITVMYAGRACETAPARTLFRAAAHPYTRALLESVPRADRPATPGARLAMIGGRLPEPGAMPSGCRFHPRCPDALAECARVLPLATEIAPGHVVSCLRAGSRSVSAA